MTRIKICGLKRPTDIDYVNAALPDYAGFVFAGSKRRVSPEQAAALRARLDARITAVGVFVDEPVDNILTLLNQSVIDVVQLHGDEDAEYIGALRKACQGLTVIKAVRVDSADRIREACELDADFLLLDNGAGGTGNVFDWSLIKEAEPIAKPFFLAGGIGADNVRAAVEEVNPFGVDMSSGVETDGVKDFDKIRKVVSLLR